MRRIHIAREYPYPVASVWTALTDPRVIPRWTATGAGGRPEGLSTQVGSRFRYVAEPKPGWSGVVECVVLEVQAPSLFRYSWQDAAGGDVTEVTYTLQATPGGTRFIYDHTGFRGIGGFVMALILGRVRRKMLSVGLPAALAYLAAEPAGAPSAR